MKIFLNPFFIILTICVNNELFILSQNYNSTDNKNIEIAKIYFQNQNYNSALPYFSDLIAKYPLDPIFNYYYGICLLETGKTSESLSFLKYASTKEVPNDIYIYLGKSYYYNYEFNKAINLIKRFSTSADSKTRKKYDTEKILNNCYNSLYLINNFPDIKSTDIIKSDEQKFIDLYNMQEIDGKIVEKPTIFKTSIEIIKNKTSYMYIPNNIKVGDYLFFAGYDDDTSMKKDIFRVQKTGKNTFSKPENLGEIINTPFDEDFPFYISETNTLYFCSQGHYGMGGFDIYKSIYDEDKNTWSPPENLDFPINTPFDDFLFVIDAYGIKAFFTSNRNEESGFYNFYIIDKTFKGKLNEYNDAQKALLYSKLLPPPKQNTRDTLIKKDTLSKSFDFKQIETKYHNLISDVLKIQIKTDSLYSQIIKLRKNIIYSNDSKEKNTQRNKLKKTEKTYDSLNNILTKKYENIREIEINIIAQNISFYHVTGQPSKTITIDKFYTVNEIDSILSIDEQKQIAKIHSDIEKNYNLLSSGISMRKQIDELYNLIALQNNRAEQKKIEKRLLKLQKDQLQVLTNSLKQIFELRQQEYNILFTHVMNFKAKSKNEILDRLASEYLKKSQVLLDSAINIFGRYKEKETVNNSGKNLFYSDSLSNLALTLLQKAVLYWLDYAIIKHDNKNNEDVNYSKLDFNIKSDTIFYENATDSTLNKDENSMKAEDTTRENAFIANVELKTMSASQNQFDMLDIYNDSVNCEISMNYNIPDETIFRIQIGVFSKEMNCYAFKGLSPITGEMLNNGFYKYYVGVFYDYQSAQNALENVKRLGFNDAFIIAYQNKINVPIFKVLNNNEGKHTSKTKIQNENNEIIFKIQIGAFREKMPEGLYNNIKALAGNKLLEEMINENGIKIYTIGNFYNFEECQEFKEYLKSHGHEGAFILAFKNGNKINLNEAIKNIK
jgi:hypothetical protein